MSIVPSCKQYNARIQVSILQKSPLLPLLRRRQCRPPWRQPLLGRGLPPGQRQRYLRGISDTHGACRGRHPRADRNPLGSYKPEQQQKRPVPDLVEVVGGLTEFLRETVPGIDISTWEKRVEEAEKDFRARRASIETGKRCIGIGVMAESSARALLDQLLWYHGINYSSIFQY